MYNEKQRIKNEQMYKVLKKQGNNHNDYYS